MVTASSNRNSTKTCLQRVKNIQIQVETEIGTKSQRNLQELVHKLITCEKLF